MKTYPTLSQNFSVDYSYALYSTSSLFSVENTTFRNLFKTVKTPTKVMFIIDALVAEKHPLLIEQIKNYCAIFSEIIHLVTDPLILTGGEQVKNDSKYVETVLNMIEKNGICRHSYVTVIGGGAIIDMVGYAAAIAHRGVRLIRVPTTVLSQNDAAVGVKNSINYFGKKNFLGTFAPPCAIINDKDFLTTLEDRDWISGISEAVKVALIKDADFYYFIKTNATALHNREPEPMQYLIHRCAELHMQHISSGDPFESGSSRPLDFGHWAAHKLEHLSNYAIRHGEAVAKGIALDISYALLLNLIDDDTYTDIIDTMQEIGFDLSISLADSQDQQLLQGIEEFREHLGGELTITLIEGIGIKKNVHDVDIYLMMKALETLQAKIITHAH